MSSIFISHSSKDNGSAERVTAWLRQRGHESLFLDFDPQLGIPAGRDWKKELFHQLRRCRAVIALCTEHFTASQWCISEVAIASNLGKSLFPLRLGACLLGTAALPELLRGAQAIDLTVTDPSDEGWERLARGLLAAGLDPNDTLQWDGKRPPYPGLMAFQEADAPLFFGREEAIREGLDQLRNLRDFGGRALLLVLGASGCGKSSLVRAGLVPKLRRDPDTWLVLDPFRPGDDPFRQLAMALAAGFQRHGEGRGRDDLRNRLLSPDGAAGDAAWALHEVLYDWRLGSGHPEASVMLVIDQFEELLVEATTGKEERGSGLTDRFLALLKDLLLPVDQGPSQEGRLLVIATLRSDFLGAFQSHPQLAGLPFEDIKLGPMPVEGYTQVIEKPAGIVGLELKEGLTQRLVADTRTGDALPLLAFTLRELWEKYGKDDGDLTLADYRDLGGLEGSVRRAADGVLRARSLGEPEIAALREAFLAMTRINEEGQYARLVARWADMPAASRPILERFVEARLLVSGKDTGTIEVAHEALLRTWPVLQGWLKEGREQLEQQRKVRRLCDELHFAREEDRLEALRQLEALAVAGNPAVRLAVEPLGDVVGDADWGARGRVLAARTLISIGGERAQEALRRILQSDLLLKPSYWDPSRAAGGLRLPLVITLYGALLREGDSWRVEERPLVAEGYREELAPGATLTMLRIPAGTFLMGSPEQEEGRYGDEGPQHQVNVREFFLAQTPITQAQWKVVAAWEKVELDLNTDSANFKGSNRPVEQVNWQEAVEFCRRLSQRTGKRYDLPSEAQWEYACRAGTTTPFFFGETITTELANYNGNDVYGDGSKGAYRQQTTPVGSFPANAWGLQDMHGNVCEWCADHWHENYDFAPDDDRPWLIPAASSDEGRLLRGGSWYNNPRYCRSAYRGRVIPDYRGYRVGFRVCCLPPGPSS